MTRNLVEEKEAEKIKKAMKDKEVLPGLETPDSTDPSFFKMKGWPGHAGVSPTKAINMEAIIGASESAEERPDMSEVYEGLAEDAQTAMGKIAGTESDESKAARRKKIKNFLKTGEWGMSNG
jgi:hypothetical protein